MEIESLVKQIKDVFSERPRCTQPLVIFPGHSEYKSFKRILDVDWANPKSSDFEMTTRALAFLSPRWFAFIWGKYMQISLFSPRKMQGNEFTNEVFSALTSESCNAFTRSVIEKFISFSTLEADTTLAWLSKIGTLGYHKNVFQFDQAESKMKSLFIKIDGNES
jgi:hypothetical protein